MYMCNINYLKYYKLVKKQVRSLELMNKILNKIFLISSSFVTLTLGNYISGVCKILTVFLTDSIDA